MCSCDKIKAKKFEGTYNCTVQFHSIVYSNPPYITDDTYTSNVFIGRKKDSLEVDGFRFPVEVVLDEKIHSFGGYHYTANIQFKGDSIYFNKSEMPGLGGKNDYTIRGAKIE